MLCGQDTQRSEESKQDRGLLSTLWHVAHSNVVVFVSTLHGYMRLVPLEMLWLPPSELWDCNFGIKGAFCAVALEGSLSNSALAPGADQGCPVRKHQPPHQLPPAKRAADRSRREGVTPAAGGEVEAVMARYGPAVLLAG